MSITPTDRSSERRISMASQATLHLTEAAFDQTLAEHKEAIVVDFWAEWCGPCKAIAPTLDELATEYAGRVTIAKVNVDEHPGLAARFQVRSIPTLLIFKGGQVIDQVVGAVPKAQIKKRLDAVA
jgi:thioredoxin 1